MSASASAPNDPGSAADRQRAERRRHGHQPRRLGDDGDEAFGEAVAGAPADDRVAVAADAAGGFEVRPPVGGGVDARGEQDVPQAFHTGGGLPHEGRFAPDDRTFSDDDRAVVADALGDAIGRRAVGKEAQRREASGGEGAGAGGADAAQDDDDNGGVRAADPTDEDAT